MEFDPHAPMTRLTPIAPTTRKTLRFVGRQDYVRRLLAQRNERLVGRRQELTVHRCKARETDDHNAGVRVLASERSHLLAPKNQLTAPG